MFADENPPVAFAKIHWLKKINMPGHSSVYTGCGETYFWKSMIGSYLSLSTSSRACFPAKINQLLVYIILRDTPQPFEKPQRNAA